MILHLPTPPQPPFRRLSGSLFSNLLILRLLGGDRGERKTPRTDLNHPRPSHVLHRLTAVFTDFGNCFLPPPLSIEKLVFSLPHCEQKVLPDGQNRICTYKHNILPIFLCFQCHKQVNVEAGPPPPGRQHASMEAHKGQTALKVNLTTTEPREQNAI